MLLYHPVLLKAVFLCFYYLLLLYSSCSPCNVSLGDRAVQGVDCVFLFFFFFFLFFSFFFFSSRRRHTRLVSDWSSDVCSSNLKPYIITFSKVESCSVNNINRLNHLLFLEPSEAPDINDCFRLILLFTEQATSHCSAGKH